MIGNKFLSVAGASEPTDAQFNYVTMLLHGDGTNGAQNNTFLDSSTNNFTITRNGNTTQGSFSPYGAVGNWSTAFSGSSQNLYTPSTTALNVGSGNFTIECFFNVSAFNGGNILRGGNQYCFALLLSGTSVVYYLSSNGSSWDLAGGSTAGSGLTVGTWCHLALVRNGNTFTPYVNGVAGTTTTSSSALAVLNGFNIGAEQNGAAGGTFNGYISNVRVVVGTAVYTSNFTPPTVPLTAVSGTQLLACQNNRFIDNSSNNFTFTTAGTPSVQRFNPFGTSTAYSTATIGGSGYFDGTGDYLTTPTSSQFTATGDFTVSFWVYPTYTSLAGYKEILGNFTAGASGDWLFEITASSGTLTAYVNGSSTNITSSYVLPLQTWTYISLVRSGTSVTLYANGSSLGNITYSGTFGNSGKTIAIGALSTGIFAFTGYISEVRLLDGSAITTVPSAPATAISGTGLLLGMTNGAIYDNAMMNDLETVGDAQISTSVKKYGTGSMYFDGSGDSLITPAKPSLDLGAGNFTIEAWIYIAGTNSNVSAAIVSKYSSTNTDWMLRLTRTGATYDGIEFDAVGGGWSGAYSFSNSTWYHVAVVRNGSSLRIYVNGTDVGGGTVSFTVPVNSEPVRVGMISYTNYEYYWNGYIDDLRITKGYARYTTTFTPPTAALPDKGT